MARWASGQAADNEMGPTGSRASLLQALQQRATVWEYLHQRQEQVQEPPGVRMLKHRMTALALAVTMAAASSLHAQQAGYYVYFGRSPSYFMGCAAVIVNADRPVRDQISSLSSVVGRSGPYRTPSDAAEALGPRWTGAWPYLFREGAC